MGTKFQSFDVLKYETEQSSDSWPDWESQCKSALVLSNLWGYITGRGVTIPEKQIFDTSTPPVLIDNPRWEDWLDENLLVLSCIRLRIGSTDRRLPSGALSQLTILQEALAIRFTRDSPLKETSDKLAVLIDSFFAVKAPTQDEWTSIIYLNAMAGPEFKDARSSLDTLLSAGTLLSSAIIARIKHEQIRINAENAEAATNEASFAAFSKRYQTQSGTGSSSAYPNGQGPCANPQCTGGAKRYHDWDHCYGPGGRMKRPEAHKGRAQRKGGAAKKEKAKAAVDSSDSESDTEPAERSFFGVDGESPRETTSVDWSTNTADEAHVAGDKPILYLDSGATSSICPDLLHFTKIDKCARSVSGVGGSSIRAVGIGEVRVRIGKGRHFVLKDVLFCPQAAITLISVGRLCDDGHNATFDSTSCIIKQTSGSGKVVANGSRTGKGLYTLNCDTAIFASAGDPPPDEPFGGKPTANIAIKARPTVETWHRRFGHVNVGTVLDMARGSTVTEKETDPEEA